MDYGARTSYMALAPGTPVLTRDGTELGELHKVLADEGEDVFDGLVVATRAGNRFVDADHAGELYERAVVLDLSAEEARHLPEPTAQPAVMSVQPDDTAERSPAEAIGDRIRKAWNLISGKY